MGIGGCSSSSRLAAAPVWWPRLNENAPVLTMTLPAPDGSYRLHVGSFTGDRDNGVFALDVAVVSWRVRGGL